jgi:hypothetical protein
VQFAGSHYYELSLSPTHKESLMYGIYPHIFRSEQIRRSLSEYEATTPNSKTRRGNGMHYLTGLMNAE